MNIPATNRLFLSIEWVFIFASICVQGCCILFQVLYVSGKSWSLTLCRPSLLCGDPICPHSFLSHSMQELFQTLSTISKLQFYHPFTFRRQTCFLVQRAGDGWWVGWGGGTGHKTKPLQLPDIKFTHLLVSGPNLSAIAVLMPHLFSGPHLHFPKSPSVGHLGHCFPTRIMQCLMDCTDVPWDASVFP